MEPFQLRILTNRAVSLSLILCFVTLFGNPVLSQQTIVLNTAFDSPISNQSQTGFADLVMSEAFARLNYQLETVQLPAERALINANRGIDDGDLGRVAGLQANYPNLIQVPEPLMSLDLVLFTKNQTSFVVESWESVTGYSLGIISGWKIMEQKFEALGNKVKLIKTDNAEQLFTLLLNDRVDFIAYSNWSGLGYLVNNDIHNLTILEPPLTSPEIYIYLHKKHQQLVPMLAKVIKQLKEDGTVQTIYDQKLKPYLEKMTNSQVL